MTELFGIGALVLAGLAALSSQWLTVAPRLGIRALYYRRELVFALTVVASTLAITAFGTEQSVATAVILALVVGLLAAGNWITPARLLPALDVPAHPAANALNDDELVVGFAGAGGARAWPVALLAPHHVVNDRVGEQPLLVAW